jgi:hypothetical protein
MIQFFFKDSHAVGQIRSSSFNSSIPEKRNATLSGEKEIPIAMLAFSATMVRFQHDFMSSWLNQVHLC